MQKYSVRFISMFGYRPLSANGKKIATSDRRPDPASVFRAPESPGEFRQGVFIALLTIVKYN